LCRRVKNPLLVFEGGEEADDRSLGTPLEQAANMYNQDILCIVIHLIVAINVVIIKMVILSVISISVSLESATTAVAADCCLTGHCWFYKHVGIAPISPPSSLYCQSM
jgi:hypothetical protein